MTFSDTTSTSGIVAQGSVSALAIAFLNDTLTLMMPFFFVAIVLIFVDLYFGVPAARIRKEKVTLSRGLRMTINKVMEYVCWVVLAATLAVAFEVPALNWIILGFVVGNEIISIVTNWLLLHGKKISGLEKALLRWLGGKVDVDMSDVEITDTTAKKKNTSKTKTI